MRGRQRRRFPGLDPGLCTGRGSAFAAAAAFASSSVFASAFAFAFASAAPTYPYPCPCPCSLPLLLPLPLPLSLCPAYLCSSRPRPRCSCWTLTQLYLHLNLFEPGDPDCDPHSFSEAPVWSACTQEVGGGMEFYRVRILLTSFVRSCPPSTFPPSTLLSISRPPPLARLPYPTPSPMPPCQLGPSPHSCLFRPRPAHHGSN